MENVKNFNKVLYQSVEKLNELSINRMLHWLIDCDCALITAFRNELKDVRDEKLTYLGPDNDWQLGKKFTHEENMQKNKDLLANLLLYGYGVAKIKGAYPEGMANENSEESYLVVNRDNNDDFLDKILNLGEFYNQDSVYYKAKGDTIGCLIGTNNCDFPGYHQKGDGNQLPTNTALSYMSSIGNQAFCYCRKDMGISNMMEAVGFWRSHVNGKMIVKEDFHPLTRKTMYESLRARNAIK